MRFIKICGRPGSQTLLENGRMLVRTNISLRIVHMFCLSAWSVTNISQESGHKHIHPRSTSRPGSCRTKTISRTSYFGTSPRGEARVDKRQEGKGIRRAWAKQDAALGTWLANRFALLYEIVSVVLVEHTSNSTNREAS